MREPREGLSTYTGGLVLWTVPFTDTQLKIKKDARRGPHHADDALRA